MICDFMCVLIQKKIKISYENTHISNYRESWIKSESDIMAAYIIEIVLIKKNN